MSKDTLVEHVDIRFTEVGDDYIAGTMPVDNRTTQPFGLLHGGATVVLAETLGSSAANCCLDMSTHYAVGLEINTNHLRSVRSGRVKATARPIHIGRSTQVWEIRTEDESGRLTAISRLTMAVVPRQER
ncbi:hotdog fold thioesterase [Thioalkalivibrio sp. XN279]|nr:hotdog fold thioesterase [Thioalkalivibrio sp. XN279]NHA13810.1 hotdog fold thioesterase [Thioalkalivibrio sp. XN279]